MGNYFDESFEYKLIYIFTINDNDHKGLLKIGDATIQTDCSVDTLVPNCNVLNQAAKRRIDQYTKTAAISYQLLHTELALRTIKDKGGKQEIKAFRDHDVHRVLINSGFKKKDFRENKGMEWFQIDLSTALKAIDSVKRSRPNLLHTEVTSTFSPIIFRPEQEIAIKQTLKQFKTGNRMLWNAKMRFGKTLCALEVVKQSKFKKTIIITHRPVVDDGWYKDFKNIFYGCEDYEYGSKNNGVTVDYLLKSGKKFVYFASMQDLRGSSIVGGKFDKNDAIFTTNWDCVVVDEAHEGTTTSLGEDVIKNVVKESAEFNTKFLALSGTPFNILNEYEDNIYTWDYVMEQQNKYNWDEHHFGDSNPYDELPELRIYTYDLGKIISDKRYVELEDKAFNFREFFRTWTGDIRSDRIEMPSSSKIGDFYHARDVRSFLDLITKADNGSQYPYSTEKYRKLFKHSLWMIPGVKEAKALSKMMKAHPVFGNGLFDIINVAGDGDEEEKAEDALKKVQEAIENAGEDGYTITLSCGKLTTGVTVPEWTAVFMLSGSFSTSAANYLQTIFRVQSPCNKNGRIKQCCYVFDFAPDRTLKMVAEAATLSTKAGKATESDKRIMGEFLNYCPVISVDGTEMKKYDTNKLLQQLKRAYAERAVKNGFDDNNLYNDELLKLDGLALEEFRKLKGIVGSSKAAPKSNEIDINNQGFTDEEYEEIERISKKSKKQRTPEEETRLKEINEKKKQKNDAISILRAISIRIPLLIYGANVDVDEDFTIDKLLDDKIVDTASWEEFMPEMVTKKVFKGFIKYYDAEIFVAASRSIRNKIKAADELAPTERIKSITALLSGFKNPDKETVLTPWRVVNMHMSDCLGGYDFYDVEHNQLIESPRFVNHGKVTRDTLANREAQILEINSKTGLYPLYVVYSIFSSKCSDYTEEELTVELQERLWRETVQKNIFVICKTPMAKQVTKRTLLGYKDAQINAHYFDDLINMMKNKPKQFIDRVLKPSYWKKEGVKEMKFDAIVGNPPYMEMDGGAQASARPIYQHFVSTAKELKPNYLSFIMPTRWYAGGKGLDGFRDEMLNDEHIEVLYDCLSPEDIFPNTNIRGGVCYFLWNKKYDNKEKLTKVVTLEHGKNPKSVVRSLKVEELDIFIRYSEAISILNKVLMDKEIDFLMDYVSPLRPFGFRGYFIKDPKFRETNNKLKDPIMCYGKGKQIGYVERAEVLLHSEWIDVWKVMTPRANNIGTELNDDNLNSFVAAPSTICTESYIVIGINLNLDENKCKNLSSYLKTKFVRFLHSLAKASQDATSKTYRFVPVMDFSKQWTDKELYAKYDLTEEEITFIEATIKHMD